MAQLSTVIGSILRDMIVAQHQANMYAVSLEEVCMWQQDGSGICGGNVEERRKSAQPIRSLPTRQQMGRLSP